jgi:pimeloyl-ACP methyl ester carboxylesterase
MMPESRAAGPAVEFAELDWDGRRVSLEYARIPGPAPAPLLVFLHEGLGSLAMWRDFPRRLCAAAACRGLVYSRPGYGRSPGPTERRRGADYLHRQALEVLPRLLDALRIDAPVWLFGHSDGGSIALLFAAHFPARAAGVIAVAPHIRVEDMTLRGIEAARDAYEASDHRARLRRYHAEPDAVFRAWTDIWLSPAFRDWTIEREIESIACPVLAVQGTDDEYATMEQIHGVARRVPRARAIELPDCGHSPHRTQPDELIAEVASFMTSR